MAPPKMIDPGVGPGAADQRTAILHGHSKCRRAMEIDLPQREIL